MKIKTFIVDAFTNEPFKGNPAGVCLLQEEINETTMQSIAGEINLSETAFLMQSKTDDTKFSIRYFTPTVEIPFCGHATLASAKIVLQHFGKRQVEFTTHYSLKIEATRDGENIKMLFPLYGTLPYNPSQQLYDAFGITKPVSTRFSKDLDMLIIEVEDKTMLLNINPDFVKAMSCPDAVKEVVVTSRSDDGEYDFYSRCFCPWLGINEDPVTGAAHAVLAKYWGDILGKNEMMAWQASKRGGYMKLNIISETELEVRSNAQVVFEGMMEV